MPRPLAPVAFRLAAGGLSAQTAEKLPPPTEVEENGVKVAVFEYGKTAPAVKVGDLTFRIQPLAVELSGKEPGRPNVGYDLENWTNNAVKVGNRAPDWSRAAPTASDDTGRMHTLTARAAATREWSLHPERPNGSPTRWSRRSTRRRQPSRSR